ncbi:MAG TPA: class I SAM-dependent methyltransferase [Streptosporangiaceae bacterium]|nr:class I SAM-dependent methyltransferase [Streptosporangiaceae bacterium]
MTDGWLNLLLDEGSPDIATLWELCLSFEFQPLSLADDLAGWLGNPAGQRILDCACGTGFPAIELARRGYDVTCSDGSALMLGYFKRRADLAAVSLQASQVRWEELADYFGATFDVVMCRGCALPYAGTWDDDAPPDRQALANSVRQFAACLKEGGRLYVDTAPEPKSAGPQITVHPTLTIGPHRVNLTEELRVDRTSRLRIWHSKLTIDDEPYRFERRSHYLPPGDLIELLRDVSFADVRPLEIPGERYAVVSATRVGI